jgi:hypothetical protein
MKEIFTITENYKASYVIRASAKFISEHNLSAGQIELLFCYEDGSPVLSDKDSDRFRYDANLNANGNITKTAFIYQKFNLKVDIKITLTSHGNQSVEIILPQAAGLPAIHDSDERVSPPSKPTVFSSKKLAHIHYEIFSPENYSRWLPKCEADIYVVFGKLEDYTGFRYCCGITQEIINNLGYEREDDTSKPDSILIEDATNAYMIAEWKMYSSAFKSNHHKNDVDVLVVWHDDETDRSILPNRVLELKSISKQYIAIQSSK